MLTIIDEFSRFPFSFSCPNMEAKTVMLCFDKLFSMFGMPSYVHSDQAKTFMSKELVMHLNKRGF